MVSLGGAVRRNRLPGHNGRGPVRGGTNARPGRTLAALARRGKGRVGARVPETLVFDAARRAHDQEADHRRGRDPRELLSVWFSALLHQMYAIFHELLEGLDYDGVDIGHRRCR